MKIHRLIEILQELKDKGYIYASLNDYGFEKPSIAVSFRRFSAHDDRPMYITIYNWDLLKKKPKKVIEGKHFAVIQVKIMSIDNRLDEHVFETKYELYATVKEVNPLPPWYDKSYYYDDFEDIEINEIDFANNYFCTAGLIEILEVDRHDFDIEFTKSVEG